MKLLVVDHNALDPANRVLYERIVELGKVELRLIVPARWHNTYRMLAFEPPKERLSYELFASEVLFPTRTHRLVYRSLHKHLATFAPDIFYINAEPENFQTYQAALMKKLSKLVFSSWRNINHAIEGYPYKLSFLHKKMEKAVLERATHAILFNHAGRKIFDATGFTRTSVIPPPVDTTIFKPLPKVVSRKFVVGYVGRLVKPKGVDILLNVLKQLPEKSELMIVADGEEKQSLQSLAKQLQIGHRVKFVDAVAPQVLPQLFAEMNLVVLPSLTTKHWKEQFGRVLVEAMACGIPVIGSTSGEIPNVIGDAGFVFKEGSLEGLKLGIERLMESDQLRNELSERGKRRVAELFSLDVVARQYHRLFLSLCD